MLEPIDGALWMAWRGGSVQSGRKKKTGDPVVKSCERVCGRGPRSWGAAWFVGRKGEENSSPTDPNDSHHEKWLNSPWDHLAPHQLQVHPMSTSFITNSFFCPINVFKFAGQEQITALIKRGSLVLLENHFIHLDSVKKKIKSKLEQYFFLYWLPSIIDALFFLHSQQLFDLGGAWPKYLWIKKHGC